MCRESNYPSTEISLKAPLHQIPFIPYSRQQWASQPEASLSHMTLELMNIFRGFSQSSHGCKPWCTHKLHAEATENQTFIGTLWFPPRKEAAVAMPEMHNDVACHSLSKVRSYSFRHTPQSVVAFRAVLSYALFHTQHSSTNGMCASSKTGHIIYTAAVFTTSYIENAPWYSCYVQLHNGVTGNFSTLWG